MSSHLKCKKKHIWLLNNSLNNKIRLFINFILFKHYDL